MAQLIVPPVAAGTLMYIQPVLQHPMGQSRIESWRYALDEQSRPLVLGQTRFTFGVRAIFHKSEVAFLLRLTYENFSDDDVEMAWSRMVPCTIHEVLQFCLWAAGSGMQYATEAIRMEALRRWCQWFVSSHP